MPAVGGATAAMSAMQLKSIEPLAKADHQLYHQLSKSSADRLVNDMADYTLVVDADGIEIYQDVASHRVKATTTMAGSVRSLLASLSHQSNTSSQAFRKLMFQYFCDSFVDGIRLHSDSGKVALHWLALTHDAVDYDLSFVSSTHAFGVEGTPLDWNAGHDRVHVGAQVWHSVHVDGIDSNEHEHLTLVSSGFVVEALDDDEHSIVSFVLQFDEGDLGLLEWQHQLAHSAVYSCRSGAQVIVPRSLWTFNAYCYLCFKSFGAFSRRHHCRLCGHAICSKCTTYLPTSILAVAHLEDMPRNQKTVPACIQCPSTINRNPHVENASQRASRHSKMQKSLSTRSVSRTPVDFDDDDVPTLGWNDVDLLPVLETMQPYSSKSSKGLFRISQGHCTLVCANKMQRPHSSSTYTDVSTLVEL